MSESAKDYSGLVILMMSSLFGMSFGLGLGTALWQKIAFAACAWAVTAGTLQVGWALIRLFRGGTSPTTGASGSPSPETAALVILAVMFPCGPLALFNLFCYAALTGKPFGLPPDEGFNFEMPEYFAVCWAMVGLSWLSVCAAKLWRCAWRPAAVAAAACLFCGAACGLNAIWMNRYLQEWGR